MLKYWNYDVVMAEVPDEVTLAINITNCPCHCKGCHSKHLTEDIGEDLTVEVLMELIDKNQGITCVAFMGGDSDPAEVNKLASAVICRSDYPYKVAWYSGRSLKAPEIDLNIFDYIKLGPYIEEFGPLNKETTNQRFYRVVKYHSKDGIEPTVCNLDDITYKFWSKR